MIKYQETILEKYGNLKLESLDTSGYIYDRELKIYQIFIPQNVKECQEYLPQVYQLPKELQHRLQEKGEFSKAITPEELEHYKKAYKGLLLLQINFWVNCNNYQKKLKTQDYEERELNRELSAKIINAIVNNWENNFSVLAWLKTSIKFDPESYIPESAVVAIVRNWQQHADTLPLIQQLARSDEHEFVRNTAIEQLVKGWRQHPKTFDLLLNCAVNDSFVRPDDEFSQLLINPRQTALEVIVEHYPDRPQTKDLLIDRANNDPDKIVREFAKQQL